MKTQTEIDDSFYSYRRGWVDGAKAASKSALDTTPDYSVGYNDGSVARHAALKKAAEARDYVPNILRVV